MMSPVLVRGMSRSGGTLMVTMLDAHPDVAMSYELYPNLLESEAATPDFVRAVADGVARTGDLIDYSRSLDDERLRTFLARLPRGGLTTSRVVELLREHADSQVGFRTPAEALSFVERCATAKMAAEGKRRWGLKCTGRYDDYLSVWPDAHLLYMVRDGRDVLASNLAKRKSFASTPGEFGRSWVKGIKGFRQLVQDPSVKAFEVHYESLVTDPEPVVRAICEFLDLHFEPSMLEFHAQSLTIFGASHLSMDRITRPVDATSMGRWRRDLTPDQVKEFSAEAAELLEELGYAEAADVD